MSTRLTIDKAGRVVIPKPLRKKWNLQPGDSLELETAGEQITLRPFRGSAGLTKENGVWVFYAGQPLSLSVANETLEQLRDERDAASLGKSE
jgi:AbrB family looped-hinge helix DNA binding protein